MVITDQETAVPTWSTATRTPDARRLTITNPTLVNVLGRMSLETASKTELAVHCVSNSLSMVIL